MKKYLVALIIVALVLVAGITYFKLSKSTAPDQIVCTKEAKICPDGSTVGRSGPKCEFEECPAAQVVDETENWKVYENHAYLIYFKYPTEFSAKDLTGGNIVEIVPDYKSTTKITFGYESGVSEVSNLPAGVCSGVWEKVGRGNYLDSYTVSCGDAGFSSKTYRIKRNSQESRVYLVKVVNEEVANAKPIPDETITNIISTLEFTK